MTFTRCDACGRRINEKKRGSYKAMAGPHCPVIYLCNRCYQYDNNRRGFTLVELMASIAIVGVLVGITLPAFKGAIESGRNLKCKVNLKTLGQSMTMYMDDGDGMLPVAIKRADARRAYLRPFDMLGGSMGVQMPSWDEHAGEMPRMDPWACPSDRDVAPVVGFSYQYEPWAFFDLIGPDERRVVTNEIMFNGFPVFSDFVLHNGTINYVDLEGTVRELIGRERR